MFQSTLDDRMLEALQRQSFDFLLYESNPTNGLVADKSAEGAPASIAAVGLALAAYPVGVERAFISRADAVARTLAALRFFWNSPQGPQADATGYKGFYYHFLDMQSGRRVWNCELSTIDSTFLLAGMLTARIYFDAENEDELEIRTLADALYRRVDWDWARNGGATVTHGWTAGERVHPLSMGRLRRGAAAVRARPRIAHPPAPRGELRRLAVHLRVEADLRPTS